MKRSLTLTLALTAALSLSLAACGGGGDSGGAPDAVKSEPAGASQSLGAVQVGGTPADRVFNTLNSACVKHGGYRERTVLESNPDFIVYEAMCADGTKFTFRFDANGQVVN
jgi:predicted small lipoprotein YifL